MLLTAFGLLSLLFSHASGLGCQTGLTAQKALTGNNYVIDLFQNFAYAYAIGQCTAVDLSGSYAKYECDGTSSITRTTYTKPGCSSGGKTTKNYFTGGAPSGDIGDFYCGASTNAYTKLDLGLSCDATVTTVAALGACTLSEPPLASQVYCDSSQAAVQFFVSATLPVTPTTTTEPMMSSTDMSSTDLSSSELMMSSSTQAPAAPTTTSPQVITATCYSQAICASWLLSTECKQVGYLGVIPVYGMMDECHLTDDTTKKSGASSLFVMANLIVALVVALFSLF